MDNQQNYPPQDPQQPVTPPPQPDPAPPADPVPANPAPPPAPPVPPVAPPANPPENSVPESYETSALEQIGSIFASFFKFLFNWFILPLAIVLILHFYVFQAFHVVGSSMVPTLHESDYLIISKLGNTKAQFGHLFHSSGTYIPARGEIVVFHYPKDPSLVFVKRVIGLPGDHVVVQNGKVRIYNAEHPDGFDPDANHQVADPVTLGSIDEVVPAGNIFVMGDNRTPNGSFDSRDWGFLPSSYMIGNAVLRLLPITSAQIL